MLHPGLDGTIYTYSTFSEKWDSNFNLNPVKRCFT